VELIEARARYFDLYDLAPVGYVTLSKHSLILEANLTAATLLGVTRSALIKQPLTRFVFPEDQKMYHHHHNQLLETGAPQTCEIRMLHTEATPFWALLEATLAQTADGVSVYRVTLNDVSERVRTEAIRQQVEAVQTEELRLANEELQTEITTRKLAEEALRHSQVFLNSIIEHSPNALWISDEHGTMMRLNQACRDNLHLRDDEVVGKYNVLKDNLLEAQGFMPLIKAVFEKGVTVHFVTSYNTAAIRSLELEQTTRAV
jgi:PAS domain S-box-containing protein